jgi:murein DD-endopeptidase MepM/ murein hydrolase activator NlpD
MSIDAANSINPTPIAQRDRTAERAEIKRLAQEFEAMLMTQMLRDMRRAMLDDEEQEQGLGAEAMTDTGDIELSHALSSGGGIGLTRALLEAFEKQIPAGESRPSGPALMPVRSGGPEGPSLHTPQADGPGRLPQHADGPRRPTPHAADLAASLTAANPSPAGIQLADITAAAPVSSRFGWRKDPITGAATFHNGVDIAVAYGRDVKAAADGRVSFAGVQNGYGQTVVIDHADGRQTRYAHLSEPRVRVGDVVAEGQVVARSGNSGRSTGPHLHFEMLVDGRPVDPAGGGVQSRAD